MSKMTKPKPPWHDYHEGHDSAFVTAFKHRSGKVWAGTKRHGISIVIATAISGGIGTVLPALQEHWQEQAQQQMMRTIYQRLTQNEKDVIELKTQIRFLISPPDAVGQNTDSSNVISALKTMKHLEWNGHGYSQIKPH
jgi:hypothetical protein